MIQKLTVVSSASGGTGKSTVSAGLGCGFGLLEQKTLLLDFGLLCGDLAHRLGDSGDTPYHLGDVAAGRCELSDAIVPVPDIPSLSVTRPPVLMEEFPGESTLLEWLSHLSEQYDRIIGDVPFWSPCFPVLSREAGETLLIVTAHGESVHRCDHLRTSSLGQHIANGGLVINRFHRKQFWKAGEFSDLDDVIDRCGLRLRAVIPEDITLTHAISDGMAQTKQFETIPFRQKGKGGAIALHCLCRRLLGERIPLRHVDGL